MSQRGQYRVSGRAASSPDGIADPHSSQAPKLQAISLAESFLEVGQFPARSDRPAQQRLGLPLACGVTAAFGIGGVIGQ